MIQPNKSSSAEDYRYGFNGMEKDDEVKGSGNHIDFGARIYDSRLGKFLSRDPKEKLYPFWTPYLFAANNPILYIDVNGEGPGDGTMRLFVTKVEIATKDGVQTAYLKKRYYENATPEQVAKYNKSALTPNGWYMSSQAEYEQFQKDPTQGAFESKIFGADSPEQDIMILGGIDGFSRITPDRSKGTLSISGKGKGTLTYGYYDADGNKVKLGDLAVDGEGTTDVRFDVSKGDGGLFIDQNGDFESTSAELKIPAKKGKARMDNMGSYGNETPTDADKAEIGKVIDKQK